jgi:hypothetical protein
MAMPSKTLVSSAVRNLVAGSGLRYEGRGLHSLRGLPEEVHLYTFGWLTRDGRRHRAPGRTSEEGPDRVKTRTAGPRFMNFSRFSAVFDQYRLGGAQKFVSDAPFSDNFRVFTQSRS